MDVGRLIGTAALAVLLGAVPAWIVHARDAEPTKLPPARMTGPCVEPAAQMRRDHPVLLADWRMTAVRGGNRTHHTVDGRTFPIGLEATCLGCHGGANEFCEKCHASAGVTLSCWGCHSAGGMPESTRQ